MTLKMTRIFNPPAQRLAPAPECLESRVSARSDRAQAGAMASSLACPECPSQRATPHAGNTVGGMATVLEQDKEVPTTATWRGRRHTQALRQLLDAWPVLVAIATALYCAVWMILGSRYGL